MWPCNDRLSMYLLSQHALNKSRKDPDWLYEARRHAKRMAPYPIEGGPKASGQEQFKAKARAYFERIKPERSMFG